MTDHTIEVLQARVRALEGQNAVRQTIARYMALCDVPARALEGESLAALFSEDAVWEGIGPNYADKFGRLQGPEQIVAMLQRYLPPTPHFSTNVHFLTSEHIESEGDKAKGRWIMLQASGYVDAKAELIAARLEVDFAPSSGDEPARGYRAFPHGAPFRRAVASQSGARNISMSAFIRTFEVWAAGPTADAPTIAIKDSINIAGYPTTAASRALADAPPATRHAQVVQRLLDAGWRITGKTNMHELAFGMTGINDFSGTPPNPQDPARIPGGSSSGSASAVGDGLVDAALGTDTGGSVRGPAACCGVIGLKPTFGACVARRRRADVKQRSIASARLRAT